MTSDGVVVNLFESDVTTFYLLCPSSPFGTVDFGGIQSDGWVRPSVDVHILTRGRLWFTRTGFGLLGGPTRVGFNRRTSYYQIYFPITKFRSKFQETIDHTRLIVFHNHSSPRPKIWIRIDSGSRYKYSIHFCSSL